MQNTDDISSRIWSTSDQSQWEEILQKFSLQFGMKPDLQAMLFLIGIQELGQGSRKYSKNEKQDLMHIATCRLLSPLGYYELEGVDQDGWPHWKRKNKLPPLNLLQQEQLLKQAIIEYVGTQ